MAKYLLNFYCKLIANIINNQQKFKAFIENELKRKEQFSEWQQMYSEKNEDLSESKQLLREESRRTLESIAKVPNLEKDTKIRDEKRHSSFGGVKLKYGNFLSFLIFTIS